MQGSNLRLLACETLSATSRLFVNVRYRAGIIRVARIAIFSQFERSRLSQNEKPPGRDFIDSAMKKQRLYRRPSTHAAPR